MNKSELLHWLRERHQRWELLLDEIGPARMEQPGVNGEWSMKDIVAHMAGWNRKLAADLQAAQRGEAEPPPPWPAEIKDEDEINGWIHDSYRGRSLGEVLNESRRLFEQLFATIEALPEDVRIEQLHRGGNLFNLLWVDEQRYNPAEFLDHFRDDHEADVRAWLVRVE